MLHGYFTLFNFVILGIILYIDRKRLKEYKILFIVAIVTAFIFENITTFLGFWQYHTEFNILLISFYTWVLYLPYIGYCYFLGNRLGGEKNV